MSLEKITTKKLYIASGIFVLIFFIFLYSNFTWSIKLNSLCMEPGCSIDVSPLGIVFIGFFVVVVATLFILVTKKALKYSRSIKK